MSTAPWCSTSVPSGRRPRRIVEGFGSEVLPQPYQQQATPTPRRTTPAAGVGRGGRRRGPRSSGARSASRQSAMPTPGEHLAGGGGVAVAERVPQAELEPVDAGGVGEPVDQRLLRDRRLRHAEAAEGAGDRPVGVDRPGARHGRAARGRGRWRAPARGSPPSAPSSRRRRCRRPPRSRARSRRPSASQPSAARMRAGWRLVVAAIDSGRVKVMRTGRPVSERREAEQRLHREVELGAEAAADRRGDDAHPLRRQAEHGGGVVAVHVGRLGAGADHQACRRRARRRRPPARYRRARRSRCAISAVATCAAAASAAAASPRRTRPSISRLPGRSRVDCGRVRRRAASAGSASAGSGVQATGKPARSQRRAGVLEGDERHRLAAEARLAFGRAPAGRRRAG